MNDICTAEYIDVGYFYNANLLAQVGIDGPPETMDEWLEQMKQLKAELPDVDAFLTQWGLSYFLHALDHRWRTTPCPTEATWPVPR